MQTKWAYLAGIIDGEGSFGVYSAGTRLSIANTHLPLLEWVKDFTGTGRIFQTQVSTLTRRPCYQWDCAARAIRVILPEVLPFMIVKRRKAELFIEYLSGIDPNSNAQLTQAEIDRRQRLIAEMRGCMQGRDLASRQGR